MKTGIICSQFASYCFFLVHIQAQTKNDEPRATFHVTAVKSQDSPIYCTSECDNCSATRFTVEGYIETKRGAAMVDFVLTCDEVMKNAASPRFTVTCAKVHANFDYQVLVLDDSVQFGELLTKLPETGPVQLPYSIVSEREESRKPCK